MSTFNVAMDSETAEQLAGPFFGFSLFPYLAFLYFLSRDEVKAPKGVIVGFSALLLFVFLTIPAAIAAKLLYGVSLADSDWLHGSAESLLTITNLVTVVAFRQAFAAQETKSTVPSVVSYAPMVWLTAGLITLAGATALIPALSNPSVHTPYLGGFMDLPFSLESVGARSEPENALTVACWIIHISSLVEFLVAMGFAWRWADVVQEPKWKGLTWGLLPLHSSGITACTYHLFYNQIPLLVPLQALLTCFGNTTAAYATFRIARSRGWTLPLPFGFDFLNNYDKAAEVDRPQSREESKSLVGFEDLGDVLSTDDDYSFLIKLFTGCAAAAYLIKYGETFLAFPFEPNEALGISIIAVPSALNAYKWYRRSRDPTFEGWF